MKHLSLLAFAAGAATLGLELSAARLLDPWFGNSQIVWAALIGLILFYLALGAWLGGRLADRFPSLDGLHMVMALAAVGIALIPTISPPVLRLAAQGIDQFQPGLLAGAMLAVLALFSLPVILLGTVSPWAVRLAVHDLQRTGQIAGRLYALATAGSIVGTFLPVLWLIPAYGTRWTFYILAGLLLAVVAVGSLQRRVGRARWLAVALLGGVALLGLLTGPSPIRGDWDEAQVGQLLYEDESLYNYIVVRQWHSERHLKLNEGVGIHSVYHPQSVLSLGIWDYFLLAPLFNPPPSLPDETYRTLIVGLAGGTVSSLLTRFYGPMPITGIELDPQIIAVGQRYFAMQQPNLIPIAADGRHWLQGQPPEERWDLIVVDAYRPPYIPFHLTTLEFFRLVHAHLDERGMVAINVGRTARNYALVDALSATLGQLFATVYVMDEPGPADDLGSSLVVATVQPTELANLAQNVALLPESLPAEFRRFAHAAIALSRVATPPAQTPILTDDRAPVEQIVHTIIWDFLRHR